MRRIDLNKDNVARANTIRDINRQIVLNYVRERGPISRAEIASETELQRSTISLIVDELKLGGLLEEVYGESTGGRPPGLLSLRTVDAVAIGVDVGTNRTVVAASDLAGRVLEQEVFETDPCADKTVAQIIKCARKLIRKNKGTIEGVGVSLPGMVEPETGTALFIPHFKWSNLEISRELNAATGLPVKADNDANAAALAELWFGRAEVRDVRDFIVVLIHEGVGTGIVFDGQIYRGKSGAAGEFGHMSIGRDAPVACAAGRRECWEAFTSERAALERYSRLAPGAGRKGSIKFEELVDRALKGEEAAVAALKETAHYLGVGIANLIQGLSPQAVIIAGLMARAWPLIAEDARLAVEKRICRGLPPARIIASTLGEQPTLMGALSLVLASKFASVSLA
ncbi:MAG TPA: ROK family transcriptional regulator [Pyrinomonadaceae bacterium]|nr:ROK family transcriptional regulator [Pyrinomonadaceae bacterium]